MTKLNSLELQLENMKSLLSDARARNASELAASISKQVEQIEKLINRQRLKKGIQRS